MTRKYLAIGLLASLTATSGFAFEENPAGPQNSPEESQFSVYDFGQGQQLAANSNSANDVATIQGKNASGGNETTIIDENGNLKIVDKKANTSETNQPLQAGTQAPGELPPSPPGMIPIQSAQNATTSNTSSTMQPTNAPANPSSGQILTPSQSTVATPTTMAPNGTMTPQPMNQAMPPAGQQMNQPMPSSGSQMNMPANTTDMSVPANQSMTGTGGQPSNGNNFSQ